jgi:hypothetical protein
MNHYRYVALPHPYLDAPKEWCLNDVCAIFDSWQCRRCKITLSVAG